LEIILTPEQQHFWNVLKFDPKTMADELGNLMQDARLRYGDASNEFSNTVDRCVFLSIQQCQNDIDLLRMTKHWLSKMQLPFDSDKMKSTDPLHNRIGGLVSKLSETQSGKQSMEWN
jgi:hypothetical protein